MLYVVSAKKVTQVNITWTQITKLLMVGKVIFGFEVQVACREGTRACSAIAKTLVLRSSAK